MGKSGVRGSGVGGAARLQWKVIFFRDQPLDHAQHVALSRQFGEPTLGHPVFGHEEGFPEVYSIAKHRRANSHESQPERRPWTGWHTERRVRIFRRCGHRARALQSLRK